MDSDEAARFEARQERVLTYDQNASQQLDWERRHALRIAALSSQARRNKSVLSHKGRASVRSGIGFVSMYARVRKELANNRALANISDVWDKSVVQEVGTYLQKPDQVIRQAMLQLDALTREAERLAKQSQQRIEAHKDTQREMLAIYCHEVDRQARHSLVREGYRRTMHSADNPDPSLASTAEEQAFSGDAASALPRFSAVHALEPTPFGMTPPLALKSAAKKASKTQESRGHREARRRPSRPGRLCEEWCSFR